MWEWCCACKLWIAFVSLLYKVYKNINIVFGSIGCCTQPMYFIRITHNNNTWFSNAVFFWFDLAFLCLLMTEIFWWLLDLLKSNTNELINILSDSFLLFGYHQSIDFGELCVNSFWFTCVWFEWNRRIEQKNIGTTQNLKSKWIISFAVDTFSHRISIREICTRLSLLNGMKVDKKQTTLEPIFLFYKII